MDGVLLWPKLSNIGKSIADNYNPSTTYAAGDFAMFNGVLKQFDGTQWTRVKVTEMQGSATNVWETGEGEHSAQTKGNNNNALGESSVAEGAETDAHSYASHTEGYMTSTGTAADYSHAEGYKTSTQGQASHAEGDNTVTNNAAEHAEGKYNKSNTGDTAADKTISSIGIGSASGSLPGGDRKNAVEVMENGDYYVIGLGNYDGSNYDEAETVQEVINNTYAAQFKDWEAND